MKKQKKSSLNKQLKIGSQVKLLFPLALLAILGFTVFSISNNYFSNFVSDLRAAVGYGCGDYGTSSTYNNDCPDPLTQSDLPNLNTLVGGIGCTPDPINATNTTTCSGTLPINYTPPSGNLNMRVEGENPVICSFVSNTFTCSGMVGASVFGSGVNIQASIDTNPFVNTGKTITVNQINFTQVDTSSLESISGGITCTPDPAEVSPETTSCTFSLPGYYNTLANNLLLRIEPEASVICSNSSNVFTCNNLTTGNSTGLKNIQAAIDANPFNNTGKQIQVNLIELKQSDLSNLEVLTGGITCTPDPVTSTTTINCTGTLPSNYIPPSSNLNLSVIGQSESTCTFIGNNFTCQNLPSGTILGSRNIQASIGTGAKTNTGKQVTVNPITFSQADVSNLESLTGGLNCNPDPVSVTNTTTCSGTLPNYYLPPTSTLNLAITGESPSPCVFTGNNFTCANLDSGVTIGTRQLQGNVGAGSLTNIGKAIAVNPIILSPADLPNLDNLVGGIDCTPSTVTVNQTTNCTGTLPGTYVAPIGTLRLNIQNQPAIDCSFIGQQFNCVNLQVGSQIGLQNVQASINSSPRVNTGSQVNVVPITLNSTNIQSLNDITGGIICTPAITEVNSTVSCSGTLPNNYVPPSQTISFSVEGGVLAPCTFSGNAFTCSNIPTGPNFGVRNIQASIGSSTGVNIGLQIIIQSQGGQSVFVTPDDVINIGTRSINDPFVDINCGDGSGTISGGSLTTCDGTLNEGYLLPLDFFLGVGSDPAGDCIQNNTAVTCTDIPVINKEGVAILLVKIEDSGSLNTNKIFTVEGINPDIAEGGSPTTETENPTNPVIDAVENLSRTGSTLTVIAIIAGLVGLFGLISLPKLQKNSKIKMK